MLLFMCCHPALTRPSAIALTLRAVGGLTTAEIASAFLVPEATMAQRISRAKQTIKASGVPFRMPTERERAERSSAVLHVLYLIFNEGYASSSGPELQRAISSNEAIRLTRAVHALLPDDAEVAGLLALMLLTDARRRARTGPDGELIPLAEQDRTLWDRDAIAEGVALVTATLSQRLGWRVSAAGSDRGDARRSARAPRTPTGRRSSRCTAAKRMSDNPMVTLNHAIAAAMVHGPKAGLELLEPLDADDATRRSLSARRRSRASARDGRRSGAGASRTTRPPPERTTSVPERNYLMTKAAKLAAEDGGDQRPGTSR